MNDMDADLLGRPLRYLIGVDWVGKVWFSPPHDGDVVEVPYQTQDAGTQYGNLRDEEGRYRSLEDANRRGRFRPYLPADDITGDYGEFTPDPNYGGYLVNVKEQIEWVRTHHGVRIEFDNPDSTGLSVGNVLAAHDLAWQAGLRTIAKNPLLVADPVRYVTHPSIDLAIVEHGEHGSDDMERLRQTIGRPLLAVRFVAYGSAGLRWARNVAARIQSAGYRNMGVTHSAGGEYTASRDVIRPITAG